VIAMAVKQCVNKNNLVSSYCESSIAPARPSLKASKPRSKFVPASLFTETSVSKIVQKRAISVQSEADSALAKANLQTAIAVNNLKNEYETKLAASEESGNKALSQIGHDLQGHSATLHGIAEIVRYELEQVRTDESESAHLMSIAKYMEMVDNVANEMYETLRDLVTISKIRMGLIEPRMDERPLREIVEKTISRVKTSAGNKGVSISNNIDSSMLVVADDAMLASALQNVISNALKFTNKGGKISISANPSAYGGVELLVQDDGVGISKSKLDEINSKGRTASGADTSGNKSTGLGIGFVFDLISANKGTAVWESDGENGATVRISLKKAD
jgi:K+-sensing histidine kinase KdpD